MLTKINESKTLSKGIMAAFVASVIATGCTPASEVVNVGSVTECIENGGDFFGCQEEWDAAEQLHSQVAPQFVDKTACSESFGDECEVKRVQNDDGSFSDVFVPMMAGMMIGNMLSSSSDHSSHKVVTQPLYREKEKHPGGGYVPVNSYSTSTGTAVSPGRTNVSSNVASKVSRVSTPIARGGFGMSARGSAAS